ncbi:MAG: hypothetical protein ACTTIM_04130 [Campylobacter sp.]
MLQRYTTCMADRNLITLECNILCCAVKNDCDYGKTSPEFVELFYVKIGDFSRNLSLFVVHNLYYYV